MSHEIGLFCHVQRFAPLAPTQGGASYWSCTLNLAANVAQGDPATIPEEFLNPWNWEPVTKVYYVVYRLDASGTLTVLASDPNCDVIEASAASVLNLAELKQRLNIEVRTGGWQLQFNPERDLSATPQVNARLLRDFHGRLGGTPFPLPQALNLSLSFLIPRQIVGGTDKLLIFAAPRITTHVGDVMVDHAPDDPTILAGSEPVYLPKLTNPPTVRAWSYAPNLSDDVFRAYLEPEVITPASLFPVSVAGGLGDTPLLDFDRGWVRNAVDTYRGRGDWTLDVPSKLAAGFDLSRRILDYFRHAWSSTLGDTLTAVQFKALRKIILAPLRDVSGATLRPRLSRDALIDIVIQSLPDDNPEPGFIQNVPATWSDAEKAIGRASIHAALRRTFRAAMQHDEWRQDDFVVWLRAIRRALPRIATLPALAEDPYQRVNDFVTRGKALDMLERVHSVLSEQQAVATLTLDAWKESALAGPRRDATLTGDSNGLDDDPPGQPSPPASSFSSPSSVNYVVAVPGNSEANLLYQLDGHPHRADHVITLRMNSTLAPGAVAATLYAPGHVAAISVVDRAPIEYRDSDFAYPGDWVVADRVIPRTDVEYDGWTIGLHFNPNGAGLDAAWDDLAISPIHYFFRAWDRQGVERGVIDLRGDQRWVFTFPGIDLDKIRSYVGNADLIWLALDCPETDAVVRPILRIVATDVSNALHFDLRCGDVHRTVATPTPVAGRIDVRVDYRPGAFGAAKVSASYRTETMSWTSLSGDFDVDKSLRRDACRLGFAVTRPLPSDPPSPVDDSTAGRPLPLSWPTALSFPVTFAQPAGLLKLWDDLGDENRAALFLDWASRVVRKDLTNEALTLGRTLAEGMARETIASANFACSWERIQRSVSQSMSLKDALKAEIDSYLVERFDRDAPNNKFRTYFPQASQSWWTELDPTGMDFAALRSGALPVSLPVFAAQLADELQRVVGAATRLEPDPLPHPLVIPFDRLGSAETPILDSDELRGDLDFFRQMSGLAVFLGMREPGGVAVRLRSLNMVEVLVEYPDVDASGDPIFTRRQLLPGALAPLRPNFVNGERRVTLAYDNDPLVVDERSGSLSQWHFKSVRDSDSNVNRGRHFRILYRPAASTDPEIADWQPLPYLMFGREYVGATSIVGIGGALSPEIGRGESVVGGIVQHPSHLLAHPNLGWPLPVSGGAPDSNYVFTHRYLRNVPVGMPRFFHPADRDPEAALPAIPSRTRPLAREMTRDLIDLAAPAWYVMTSTPPAAAGAALPPPAEQLNEDWSLEFEALSFAALDGDRDLVLQIAEHDLDRSGEQIPAPPPTLLLNLIVHCTSTHPAQLEIRAPGGGPIWRISDLPAPLVDLRFRVDAVAGGAARPVTAEYRANAYEDYRPAPLLGAAPHILAALGAKFLWTNLELTPATPGACALQPPRWHGVVDSGGMRLLRTLEGRRCGLEAAHLDDQRARMPLVLLSPSDWLRPARSEAELQFSRPSTSLETWLRWRRDEDDPNGNGAALRQGVLAHVYFHRDQAAASKIDKLQQENDDWLDDPATAPLLYIEAVPLRVLHALPAADRLCGFLSLPNPRASDPMPEKNTLDCARSAPRIVKLTLHDGIQGIRNRVVEIDRAGGADTARLHFLPGEVWQLRIHGCVPKEYFDDPGQKRFDAARRPARSVERTDGGVTHTYYLAAPATYLVEGAIDLDRSILVALSPSGSVLADLPEVDDGSLTWSIPTWARQLGFDLADQTLIEVKDLTQVNWNRVAGVLCFAGLSAADVQPLKTLGVPVVALDATVAMHLGLAQNPALAAGPSYWTVATQPDGEREILRASFRNGEVLRMVDIATVESLPADATAKVEVLVDQNDPARLAGLALDVPCRVARRVAMLLPQKVADAGVSRASERFFKSALRWALRAPLSERLWQSIEPTWTGDQAIVNLNRRVTTQFDYLCDLELLRQDWRWRGFPVSRFPLEAAAPDQIDRVDESASSVEVTPTIWDAEAFPLRREEDHVRLMKSTTLRPLTLPDPLESRNRANDLRAAYERYSLIAHSRYAGLAPKFAFPALRFGDARLATLDQEAWRRLYIPCRWREPLPKPKLALAFPLTVGKARTSGASGGFVLVLNESWFQIAGLAETLRVEVELVSRQVGAGAVHVNLAEAGPDPTLSDYEIEIANGVLDRKPVVPLFDVTGPVGLTFDRHAEEAQFNRSWFVVDPAGKADWPDGFDWSMAKVRLRRQIAAAADGASPTTTGDLRKNSAFDVVAVQPIEELGGAPQIIALKRSDASAHVVDELEAMVTTDGANKLLRLRSLGNSGQVASFPWSAAAPQLRLRGEFRGLSTAAMKPIDPFLRWSVAIYARTDAFQWERIVYRTWDDPDSGSPLLPTVWRTSPTPQDWRPDRWLATESNATDSAWIQMLPDSTVVAVLPEVGVEKGVSVDRLQIERQASPDATAIQLTLTESGYVAANRVQLPPSIRGHAVFFRLLAVTEIISDVRGSRDNEKFVALYQFQPRGTGEFDYIPVAAWKHVALSGPMDRYLARILTFQARPGSAMDNVIELFKNWLERPLANDPGYAPDEDETVRLISVSPPIPGKR